MGIYKTFDKKQKRLILLALILSVFAITAGLIYDGSLTELKLERLKRPEAYEQGEEISFEVEFEGMEEVEPFKYMGEISAVKLREEEIYKALNSALDEVETSMFKQGESVKNIMTGVYIPARLKENPSDINFSVSDRGILLEDGSIARDLKEKKETELTVTASYEDIKESRTYRITVLPRQMSTEERLRAELEENLDSLFEADDRGVIALPKEISGNKVSFFIPKEEITGSITGLSLMATVMLFAVFNESNKKKIKAREVQLKDGYADFIGRFVILLGAGLGVSAVWRKLETAFKANKSISEEIKITLREIENGKTEREAYENFGRRIGSTEYIKFSAILNQSLKMGSGQILMRLETEAETAMNERRNLARSKGEEADTKILMPMLLQLVLIIIIVMIPALLAV